MGGDVSNRKMSTFAVILLVAVVYLRVSAANRIEKTLCQKARGELLGESAPHPPPPGAYVPQCDENGEFKPMQFHGSTGYSWCVARDGTEIPGSRTPRGRPPPTCKPSAKKSLCQTARDGLLRKTAPHQPTTGAYVPQCDENGEFKPLQFHASSGLSWCVACDGTEIPGSRTPPGRPAPTCKPFTKKTACQKAREEVILKTAPELPPPGAYVPQCDENGEYEPVQFHASSGFSWCVARDGTEIPGSRTPPGRPAPTCEPFINEDDERVGEAVKKPVVKRKPSRSRYQLVRRNMDWHSAANYCQERGDQLVMIRNEQEQTAVSSYLSKFTESTLKKCRRHPKHGVYLWTAGRRVTSKHGSSFIWMVNARIYPMTYSHWKSGQPDNLHGREGCVNLWWGSGYRWSDLSCDVHVCFVCERSR